MHSIKDLNCYFFQTIYSNNLNSDNVKTKLQPGIIVSKQWHQRKRGDKMLTTRVYRKKKAEEYRRKDRERKQFQRGYRKYFSDSTKYEEFKRRDLERKAAKKASKLATYSKETLSSSSSSSFKHYATKARSLKKVENALPNSPRKKVEIVTSLASKFNLRIAAPRNKSGRPKQTVTEEQVEWLVRDNLCNSLNGQYLIIAKTNDLKLCCFYLLISLWDHP